MSDTFTESADSLQSCVVEVLVGRPFSFFNTLEFFADSGLSYQVLSLSLPFVSQLTIA